MGRLHPVKDHAFLISACVELKQRGLPFLCIIIGEGETRRSLHRLIERMGLPREVKLLGFLDQPFVNIFYQMADVFVLTSRSEGLPFTIMEAMLNETIVLAPKITGIPEIITNGVNGFLYEGGNMEDFVNKILYIFEKYESLRSLGKQARNHILQYFDRRTNMEAFADTIVRRLESANLTDR